MASVNCCGFECGLLSHGVATGTASIVTSGQRTGLRALRTNPTSSNGYVVFTAVAAEYQVGRVYVYFTSLPTSDIPLVNYGTSGIGPRVKFTSADNKIWAGIGASTLGATGVTVTTGQWYRIDFKFYGSSGTDTCDVQVDGTACGQASGAGAAGTVADCAIGLFGSTTADVLWDDFVLTNASGDYPLGPGHVDQFIPVSDGTHNIAGANDFERTTTGTDITNSTTDAYLLVAKEPLPTTADTFINQVAPANATDYVEVAIGPGTGVDTPTAAPRAVEFLAVLHMAGTGQGACKAQIIDAGSSQVIYAASAGAGVTAPELKRGHAANKPSGGAWTTGAFNGLLARFGPHALTDSNPDQYYDALMVEAEFQDADSGITGSCTSTLGAVTTSSGTATASVDGSAGQTLGAVTVPGTATVSIDGSSAQTLDAATAAGTGAVVDPATGSTNATLGDVTSSATADLTASGTTSATLGEATSSATADLTVAGTASQTLAEVTASGNGTIAIDGTAASTLDAVTVPGTAAVSVDGSATPTLEVATASGTATVSVDGSASQVLGEATVSATGSIGSTPAEGTLSQTLDEATSSTTATVSLDGSTSAILGEATNSGTATVSITGTASATLEAVGPSATAGVLAEGSASQTLGEVSPNATADLVAAGSATETLGDVSPDATAELGVGGTSALVLEAAAASATAAADIDGSASETLETASVSASGITEGNPPHLTAPRRTARHSQFNALLTR